MTPKDFPARLRQARETAGQSIRGLAAAADLGPSAIVNYEAGKTDPDRAVVERLALALGVSPCWLAYGVGSKEVHA